MKDHFYFYFCVSDNLSICLLNQNSNSNDQRHIFETCSLKKSKLWVNSVTAWNLFENKNLKLNRFFFCNVDHKFVPQSFQSNFFFLIYRNYYYFLKNLPFFLFIIFFGKKWKNLDLGFFTRLYYIITYILH